MRSRNMSVPREATRAEPEEDDWEPAEGDHIPGIEEIEETIRQIEEEQRSKGKVVSGRIM